MHIHIRTNVCVLWSACNEDNPHRMQITRMNQGCMCVLIYTIYTAVCCSVLQCVAVCGSVWQCVAVCCRVLQCAAMCCSVLQCVAVCMNLYYPHRAQSDHTDAATERPTEAQAVEHSTLQHTALQHTATHCNTRNRQTNINTGWHRFIGSTSGRFFPGKAHNISVLLAHN